MSAFDVATEPARIRGLVAAVLLLAGAVGLNVAVDLPGIAEGVIALLAVVVPVFQAESTRAKVRPVV